MKRRKRVVPDFLRRALRQAIGVGGAVCLGYLIMDPLGGWDSRVATQWLQGCKWAGITIVVVSAPVIGKVAQYSLERTLGTIAGGLLGYTVVVFGHSITELDDVWFTTCTTAVVAFSAAVGGHAIGLDYSFKLFVLTFLLVIMGAERSTDAFLVMLTRVAGIVLGVFLSLLLSVLIFPKSASHEATDSVYYSLAKLADLNRIAWNIEWDKDDDDDKGAGYVYSSGMTRKASTGFVVIDGLDRVTDRPHSTERDRKEADCEQVLMDVYSKLSKCQEFLAVSKSETYLLTLRGRWCFLPGIPWVEIGRWKLPQQELSILATSIRKVARVLWALHVTFQEGFEDEVMQLLRKRYPPDMMPELQLFSQGALDDLKDAFPEAAMVKTTNLHRFLKAVQELIRHSDQQRRAVVRYMQETSAGYISKVRWYSFQFLMQQLADELNDAYVAMSNVLARLPK
ncbi:hypothetical protein WJX72_005167 [[Myrmecia] bisecta]|uniref:p-hydroxybenzoic acid efflux pump subunit AaeB n=1 Tax=[Myrmecia] bisecta TaxID=41462 RepID=A0AAW1P9M8_9CHLO